MASMDALINEIGGGVLECIKPYLERQQKVINEQELMTMLGVKSKSTVVSYRERGLVGYRIDHRHWVYFMDDVENFIRTVGKEW